MRKILFVCTGNTCRSIMAQALFNEAVNSGDSMRARYAAFSRGIYAPEGEPASAGASEAMKKLFGVSLAGHLSKRISAKDVQDAFLILTMSADHKAILVLKYPDAAERIFTLKEYIADRGGSDKQNSSIGLDVSDPFCQPDHVFRKCAEEINTHITKLISMLKKLS
jgi:protein-tyrosine phosphatase